MQMVRQLLKVKEYREQQAEKELVLAKNLLGEAILAVEKAKKDLKDYQQFVIDEDVRLHKKLYNKVCKISEIQDVRTAVSTLQSNQVQYEEQVQLSEERKKEKELDVKNKKVIHNAAVKARSKYEDYLDMMKKELDRANELKAEDEVDELFAMKIKTGLE